MNFGALVSYGDFSESSYFSLPDGDNSVGKRYTVNKEKRGWVMIQFGILSELNELSVLFRLLLAMILGGSIGFERGRHGRAAGLRTHVLVAVGAAMTSIIGEYIVTNLNVGGDPTRIASGVVSGIGFLGAGMILVKNNSRVTGLTTAAALWATSTLGLAVGAGLYIGAVIEAAIIILATTFLTLCEVNQKKDARFYVEITEVSSVNDVADAIRQTFPKSHSFEIVPAKSGTQGNVGLYANITAEHEDRSRIIAELKAIPHVLLAIDE